MTNGKDDQTIQDFLTFWFSKETKARWYASTPVFDDHCRERFGELAAKAGRGELGHWEKTADGALALGLLLDQIPRNIHRGQPTAFENDPKAVDVVARAIERGLDRQLSEERRNIFYLPFMHSEKLTDQERGVELYTELGSEKGLAYAKDHADIIRRFGRFPHRNAILGRQNTGEEQAFLDAGAKDYGQSTKKG